MSCGVLCPITLHQIVSCRGVVWCVILNNAVLCVATLCYSVPYSAPFFLSYILNQMITDRHRPKRQDLLGCYEAQGGEVAMVQDRDTRD